MTIELNFKSDLKVRWLYRLLLVMIAGGGTKIMWKFLILSVGEAIESGRLLARPFAGDCKSASALGSSTSAERLKLWTQAG